MALIIFALLGLAVLASTIGSYLWLGGFALTLSHQSAEWANFGTYVGGMAGPPLSFLALIALVWTVRLQSRLLGMEARKQRADQQLRWLEAIYAEMLHVLR